MTDSTPKYEILTYELKAVNFAENSSNKIHSDEVARNYGFAGGLVPGIAVYAYMTHPVVERLGLDWLQTGTITAKLIKPVYAGDMVRIQAKWKGASLKEFEILVENAEGTLCAVGSAGIVSHRSKSPDPSQYPRRPLPANHQRKEARAVNLPAGTQLGTLDFHMEPDGLESKVRNDYQDHLSVYSGPDAVCHPAYMLEQANQILARNVDLGPWIHTKSEVQNFSSPKAGEKLSIRGFVTRSYEKRDNELVDLDLAIFDSKERGIAKVKHTAIVRLKPQD